MTAIFENGITFAPGRPQFDSPEALQAAALKKGKFEPASWYPRDVDHGLKAMENRAGELLGVDGRNVTAYNYGMTAIRSVLESADPTQGTRVLWDAGYSQTRKLFGYRLQKRRANSIRAEFDTSSADEMRAAIERFDPNIVFLETMGNDEEMRVPNIEALLDATKDRGTLVILDHTLPFSTGRDLAPMLKERPEQDVVVVYSGTKAFGQNSWIPSGIAVTYNEERLRELLETRTMDGTRIPPPSVALMEPFLRLSKEKLDNRLLKIYGNTLFLARMCAEVERESMVSTRHPNVKKHPHKKYADATYLSRNGGSPVFFLALLDTDVLNQFDLIRALGENEKVQRHCGFGTSFGFDQTAILHDQHFAFVRVSPGTESPEIMEEIATGFQEVLLSVKPKERVLFIPGETIV